MPARITRRRVLGGGAGAAVLGGIAASATWLVTTDGPAPAPQRVPLAAATPLAPDAVATTEWIPSAARHRSVRLVTVAPRGVDRTTLPVCVGLHGLGGTASWWADAGMRRRLGAAWAGGVPPFVVAALDGGDNYWHPFRPSDDPMRMLLEELPGWLTARGLATATGGTPVLAAGVSMGGAGALLYARERARRAAPVRGVAALSPGLFLDWKVANRRPFAGVRDWEANDPLRFYPELAGTPMGVWCGDRDQFVAATRRFIDLARPQSSSITPGRHDGAYYASILPQVFAFLGRRLRTAGGPAGAGGAGGGLVGSGPLRRTGFPPRN